MESVGMKKLFYNEKYHEALYPRAGLRVDFESESKLFAYLFNFFPNYHTGTTDEFMEELVSAGIVTTTVKASFLNKVEFTSYTLDCHKLLEHLSLIEQAPTKDSIQLYTIQQVAQILAVTRQTVYNLIHNGYLTTIQLKGVKGQRIHKSTVQDYINKS